MNAKLKKETDLNLNEYLSNYAPKKDSIGYISHLARYHFCLRFIKNKKEISWLDCGSGEGFGVAYLSTKTSFKKIVSVDNHKDIQERARKIYGEDTLASYVCCDVCNLPFEKESFNLVTAFDLIEHIKDPEQFFKQVKKIIKSPGIFIFSTPNRLQHVLLYDLNYIYPFHAHEYFLYELICLIDKHFKNNKIRLFGQNPYLFKHYHNKTGIFFKRTIYQRILNRFIMKIKMPNYNKVRKECLYISNKNIDVCGDFIVEVEF